MSKDAGGFDMESRYTWKNQLLMGLRNFAVLGGVIVLLGYLIIISGEAAKQELEELFVEEKRTITHIDEPVVYGYEDGAKVWELRSEVAETEKETDSSELSRIYELILFKGGEENILIRGDHGDWDKPREKLTLTGNVVVESADGTTILFTEKLIWEERNSVLSCPVPVDFWVEDNHFIANSLYSDDDMATIDFVGDVVMFVVGLEGENFVTREGDFPIEDVEGEEKGDGMNVLAEYVHYDKGDRLCYCYPYIPLSIRSEHNLDEAGRQLPEQQSSFIHPMDLLLDEDFIDALQRSIAQTDLSPEEQAFLAGEVERVEPPRDPFGYTRRPEEPEVVPEVPVEPSVQLSPSMPEGPLGGTTQVIDPNQPRTTIGGAGRDEPPGTLPMTGGRTSPFGPETPAATDAGEIFLGPEVSGPVAGIPHTPIDMPTIPRSDPEIVLSAPDYSRIEDWEISDDLESELYEEDEGFVAHNEIRDGLVFCYRLNKKIWCEELYIDLGEHRVDALRQVDARFSDMKDEDREPPESRAGRSIQESPSQFIGNYMIHNWEENVTEGYGRVLMLQREKDIEADNIVYYEDADVVHAWGDVILHQYGGEWWETSGAIEDVEDERAREDVRDPTVITADAMLSYNNRVTWGFGNVVFRQEKQTVLSERAQYEEENEILTLAGDVDYENEDGEQLNAALLTLDLYTDEYIAEGAAIARNIVPEEYRENLAEFRDDEETKPEDEARTRLLENRTSSGLGDWSFEIEHPPMLPPMEFLPDAQSDSEAESREQIEEGLPQFMTGNDLFPGPAVPPPGDEPSTTGMPDPVLMEVNEETELPPSVADDEGIVMIPLGEENIVIDMNEPSVEDEMNSGETDEEIPAEDETETETEIEDEPSDEDSSPQI